jgi:hypothetical protein
MALVVRREHGHLRRYVHLGTGNYHPRTARAYTDYGLLSAKEALGEDVHQVFMQLTSLMRTPNLNLLSQSPFNLHERLLALIRRETRNAANGGTGHIIAKLNALVEPEVIRALYEASGAGVHVDLIVRGICCLRPGIPGVSENIRVRSIVGRFLEHSRVYYFHNGGDEELYCASADWMERNFFRRIELMFPLTDAGLKARVIADLDTYLADNIQAWELRKDGRYEQLHPAADQDPTPPQVKLLRQRAAATKPRRRLANASSKPRACSHSISCSRSATVSGLSSSHPCGNLSSSKSFSVANAIAGRSEGLRLRCSNAASRSKTTSLNMGGRQALGSSSRNGSSSFLRCSVTRHATSCCSSRTNPGRSECAIR